MTQVKCRPWFLSSGSTRNSFEVLILQSLHGREQMEAKCWFLSVPNAFFFLPIVAGLRPQPIVLPVRFLAKRKQHKMVYCLLPERQGQNQAVTVLYVPNSICSLDSGTPYPATFARKRNPKPYNPTSAGERRQLAAPPRADHPSGTLPRNPKP